MQLREELASPFERALRRDHDRRDAHRDATTHPGPTTSRTAAESALFDDPDDGRLTIAEELAALNRCKQAADRIMQLREGLASPFPRVPRRDFALRDAQRDATTDLSLASHIGSAANAPQEAQTAIQREDQDPIKPAVAATAESVELLRLEVDRLMKRPGSPRQKFVADLNQVCKAGQQVAAWNYVVDFGSDHGVFADKEQAHLHAVFWSTTSRKKVAKILCKTSSFEAVHDEMAEPKATVGFICAPATGSKPVPDLPGPHTLTEVTWMALPEWTQETFVNAEPRVERRRPLTKDEEWGMQMYWKRQMAMYSGNEFLMNNYLYL